MKRVDQIGGRVHHAAKGEYPRRIKETNGVSSFSRPPGGREVVKKTN